MTGPLTIDGAKVHDEIRTDRGSVVLPADDVAFFEGHIRVKTGGRMVPWSLEGHEFLAEPLFHDAPVKAIQKAKGGR